MTPARAPLSVVVATRDRPEFLARCLASLQAELRPGDDVVVVDSASRDPAAVQRLVAAAGVRLLRADRPGASHARNLGWRSAPADIVAFVDDDVTVLPGWADALVSRLQRHPEAAFVTGRVGIPPGQGTLAVAVMESSVPLTFGRGDAGLIGHSANLAVPRRRLAEVGGFDESLGAGGRWRAAEDSDLFDRLLATGAVGCYEPAAAAVHDQWRRARQYVVVQYGYGVGSGARMAKLMRTDPDRLRRVAVADGWEWGLRLVPGELLRRDWPRAAGTIARLLGMLVGVVTAAAVPVRDGHLTPRRSSAS